MNQAIDRDGTVSAQFFQYPGCVFAAKRIK